MMIDEDTINLGLVRTALDGDMLVCPKCGCTEVHIGQVATRKEGRGSLVSIAMECEGQCRFDVEISFNKGTTRIAAISAEGEPFNELWRD